MKKVLLLLSFILTLSEVIAQIDCSSGRFDTEVFTNVNVTYNVVYGANTDVNGNLLTLKMDVYEPANDTMTARPLIVWAHGGSFLAGSKSDNDVVTLCQRFAKRGYVCASIDYRLGIPFPVGQTNATKAVYRATQDMKAAVRFFRKDAMMLNVYKSDPNIIFAGGSSAGAFTALHLAYLDDVSEIPAEIDTTVMGNLEGNSGNPGYASTVNAVIDLCGAIGDRHWVTGSTVPFVAMHGTNDNTVPYGRAMIYLLGAFPIMVIDGSYAIAGYADSVGVYNQMYTWRGAGHVPYASNPAYMDTTVSFVSNFLYQYFGCVPRDPNPLPNTFVTEIRNTLENRVIVYPNPANEYLIINSNENIVDLTLMSVDGKQLQRFSQLNNNARIDVSALAPGIYFITINTPSGRSVQRLVVE